MTSFATKQIVPILTFVSIDRSQNANIYSIKAQAADYCSYPTTYALQFERSKEKLVFAFKSHFRKIKAP